MASSRTLFSQSRSWHSKSILSSREYWMSVRVKKEPKGFQRKEVRPIFLQIGLVRYSLDTSTALEHSVKSANVVISVDDKSPLRSFIIRTPFSWVARCA
jgi:hypothetical protein